MHYIGGEKKKSVCKFVYVLIFLYVNKQVLSIQYLFIVFELEKPSLCIA